MPEYSDIELAFEFVSSAPHGTNRAVFDRATGRFLYASDMSGENEIPDDIDEDQCVEVPHKHDLDLGQRLVFQFVLQAIPGEEETVHRIFKRPGAYGRFKDFLEKRQLLQQWYDYSAAAQREAIEQWCKDNGIDISQQRGSPDSPPAASSGSGDLRSK